MCIAVASVEIKNWVVRDGASKNGSDTTINGDIQDSKGVRCNISAVVLDVIGANYPYTVRTAKHVFTLLENNIDPYFLKKSSKQTQLLNKTLQVFQTPSSECALKSMWRAYDSMTYEIVERTKKSPSKALGVLGVLHAKVLTREQLDLTHADTPKTFWCGKVPEEMKWWSIDSTATAPPPRPASCTPWPYGHVMSC